MAHPIVKDPPSTDMIIAQARQHELDAQIEAFLAKGGKIGAYDNLSRPIESTPWRSQSIDPLKHTAAAAPAKAKRSKPATVAPVAEPARPVPAQEVVIATIPVSKPETIDIGRELRELRKQAAAVQRRLDRLHNTSGVRS